MRTIALQNLSLELTRKCNLECRHCVRGKCENLEMSDELIDRVFDEVDKVGMMSFIGGETSLATGKLEKLYESIKSHNTEVDAFLVFTNAVNISFEFIEALKKLESLAMVSDKGVRGLIRDGVYKEGDFPLKVVVSLDKFHLEAMDKAGIDRSKVKANIERLAHYFPVELDKMSTYLIYDVGNAENVTDTYKTPIHEYKTTFLFGANSKTGNSLLLVGPHVSVDAKGRIVDCNNSYAQVDERGYGDILGKGFYESIKEKIKTQKCKRAYSYNGFFSLCEKYMKEFHLTKKDVKNIIKFNNQRGQKLDLSYLYNGSAPSLAELDSTPDRIKKAPSN